MHTSADYINKLGLIPHVEGGYYKEIYRSTLQIKQECLPEDFKGDRSAATCIYFLLEARQFSAFHRIASDELWHHLAGDPIDIYEINTNGDLIVHHLGHDLEKGQMPIAVVTAGNWFGSSIKLGGVFGLCSCTVAPGFDFADFELGIRADLSVAFPHHSSIIESLTRG